MWVSVDVVLDDDDGLIARVVVLGTSNVLYVFNWLNLLHVAETGIRLSDHANQVEKQFLFSVLTSGWKAFLLNFLTAALSDSDTAGTRSIFECG